MKFNFLALLAYGKSNFDRYSDELVAAMDLQQKSVTFFHNEYLGFSIPISINLLTNAILKFYTSNDYSISLSIQNMESKSINYLPYDSLVDLLNAPMFLFVFFPFIALFVVHPLRESSTHVKHLQRMAGASYFTYWGTIFIFDLTVFFVAIVLTMMTIIIVNFAYDLQMFYAKEVRK